MKLAAAAAALLLWSCTAAAVDYERRIVDIPMRDGVALHTVIVVPKGAKDAPILLTRTPYGAERMTGHAPDGDLQAILDGFDNPADVIVEGGYIRVLQDVRGRHDSGGDFVMTRPLNPGGTDESTDAYDTIDWLVRHVRESSGKVGLIGTSYDGFEVLMGLVHPHPALKAAVPMNPMVDGWIGDDWFHNGAFRQLAIPAIRGSAARDGRAPFTWTHDDLYDAYMAAGSAGELGRRNDLDRAPFWRAVVAHPAYDAFWQDQAVDRVLARQTLTVPVLLVHSLWDQEDVYGALAVYRALEPRHLVQLTLGPWTHAQPIESDSDTGTWWRKHVLAPFLAQHLKGAKADLAPVVAFQSGTDIWQRLQTWPAADTSAKLYLQPNRMLGFDPTPGAARTESYVADPADPIPFVARPYAYGDKRWGTWIASDQRTTRSDVLTFTSDVLPQKVTVAGEPVVHLTAATSGTDSDWVVKLLDVQPDGRELPIAMEIFRGRYRQSFTTPAPLQPNAPLSYRFSLPAANHVFLPGHRIAVQVQSSWFPLYDRNPQTYVPNIFFAGPADYVKATQAVTVAGPAQSFIELPLIR